MFVLQLQCQELDVDVLRGETQELSEQVTGLLQLREQYEADIQRLDRWVDEMILYSRTETMIYSISRKAMNIILFYDMYFIHRDDIYSVHCQRWYLF